MERPEQTLPDAVYRLDEKLAGLATQESSSLSRELLLGGASAISIKLSEEFAEVLAAFLKEDDDSLLDEAQSVVWLAALGMRTRNIELVPVLRASMFSPQVEQKGDELNDAIRSFGDAKGRFVAAMFTDGDEEVSESSASFIGALSNLLELRGITMQQVYERL